MTSRTEGRVSANAIDFAHFEQGEGPLAPCMHGYPDTAYTWRYLLHELAARSEEHPTELQANSDRVCRTLLEKKK